jgi:hypothetical protein
MIVGYKAPREPQLVPGSLLIIPLASGRLWLSCRACRSVSSGGANIDVFNLDLPTSMPNDPLDPDLHFSRPALRDPPHPSESVRPWAFSVHEIGRVGDPAELPPDQQP